jgi:hypothetical protein
MFLVARDPKELTAPRNTFGVGNDSQQWINHLEKDAQPVEELMKLTRNKRHFYRHRIKAVTWLTQDF